MDEALEMLRDQLTGLLDISKLDARIVSAHRKPIDLVRFTHRLRDEFAHWPSKRSCNWCWTCRPALASTSTVTPCCSNASCATYLDNAIKYCDAVRSDCVCNRLNPAHSRRRRVGSFRTPGAAFPGETEKIFEEFYQLDNPERDRSRGMGLGLAIVKRLTQLLGIPCPCNRSWALARKSPLTLPLTRPTTKHPNRSGKPSAPSQLPHSGDRR